MKFSHRSETSDSTLQLALLAAMDQNIYSNTSSSTNNEDKSCKNEPRSIYDNIFQQKNSDVSTSAYNSTDYEAPISLFPLFDYCLYIFPMWITYGRRLRCINIVGILITFLFAVFYSLDALSGGYLDSHYVHVYNKIMIATNAILIPTQIICQLIFYAKHFRVFWTNDKRDNHMVYFIAQNNKYRFIYYGIFIYVLLNVGMLSMYTFANDAKQHHLSPYFNFDVVGWETLKYIFFYIPRSLHAIVIFLYCLEWRYSIRYLWKHTFIEYLHEASLLKHYKNMIRTMEYQSFWIKGWMAADALAFFVAVWYWLWVWLYAQSHTTLSYLVIEGCGCIFYHSMGFILTWIAVSSVSAEADVLYQNAFRILEKLNEQHFDRCFKSDAFNQHNEKLVDYHVIDFNDVKNKDIEVSLSKYRNNVYGHIEAQYSMDDHDYEESWKSKLNNKNIRWEEWIYNNNNSIYDIKQEMKRTCLIKQLETFILFYNHSPCTFRLGICTIRYDTIYKMVALFMTAKFLDYLWGVITVS